MGILRLVKGQDDSVPKLINAYIGETLCPLSQKRTSLLKKSPLGPSLVPNQAQNRPKTALSTLERGLEKGVKEFFNKLERF